MGVGKFFKIRSRLNGKVLTVRPGGREVAVASDGAVDAQAWAIFSASVGLFGLGGTRWYIISASPAARLSVSDSWTVLDVKGASRDDHAAIQVFPNHEGDNQKWDLRRVDGGYWKIVSFADNKVLDIRGASTAEWASVQQFPDHDGTNQQWEFVLVANVDLSGSVLMAPLSSPDKAVDLRGGAALEGTPVQLYQATNAQNQWWTLIPRHDPGHSVLGENSWFMLGAKGHPGVGMAVAGASSNNGAPIQVQHLDFEPHQQWELIFAGIGDVYKIANRQSGKVLDVKGGSRDDHTLIQQFTDHGGENQRFRLYLDQIDLGSASGASGPADLPGRIADGGDHYKSG